MPNVIPFPTRTIMQGAAYTDVAVKTAVRSLNREDQVTVDVRGALLVLGIDERGKVEIPLEAIADFQELAADPVHVGEAVAALVMDELGVEHDLPERDITLVICRGEVA